MGGPLWYILNIKWLGAWGLCCYPIYTLAIYIANQFQLVWLAVMAGILLGLGAGAFWTAQLVITLGYAPASARAGYVSQFWAMFNGVTVIVGTAAFLSAVYGDDVFHQEYLSLAACMTLAAGISFFVLFPTDQVGLDSAAAPADLTLEDPPVVSTRGHKQGTRSEQEVQGTELVAEFLAEEVSLAFKVLKLPQMLLMTPLFIGSIWYYVYRFNFLNSYLFAPHFQNANMIIFWGMQTVSGLPMWWLLDRAPLDLRRRAALGVMSIACLQLGNWVACVPLQYTWKGGNDKDWGHPPDPIQFGDLQAIYPVLVLALAGLADGATQIYAQWFVSVLSQGNFRLAARYGGYYKAMQSAGSALAWGIDLSPRVTFRLQMWINIAHCLLSMPLALIAALHMGRHDVYEGVYRRPYSEEMDAMKYEPFYL